MVGRRRNLAMFLLLGVVCACGPSPDEARQQIAGLGLEFDQPGFLERVRRGDTKAVELYIRAGIDVNDATQLPRSLPLYAAMVQDQGKVVALLLKAGADPGLHPALLGVAVERGEVDLVRFMLRNGAAADARAEDGRTALMIAASANKPDVVRLLVASGADVNEVQLPLDGATALHHAADARRVEAARALLDAGAAIDLRGGRGRRTPLMLAAGNGHLEMVELLLERGADPQAANPRGQTALTFARRGGHDLVAERLQGAAGPAGG